MYTVRPDGTDLRRLTTDGQSWLPEWTLSDQIRFRRGGINDFTTFWLMDADGTNVTEFVDLDEALAAIDPPGDVGNVSVPDDPASTFYWQPAP